MATTVVQFREDVSDIEFLRSKGINPNDFARQAFEDALRVIRAQERYEKLRELRVKVKEDPALFFRRERDRR
ncbi:MAG: hypothetical protein HYT80_12160 [Euryarchaeota archaeon]|nr:hypothetical protein [Euryarchaeota archaeon]